VPRFYFDVREGAKLTSDEAGRELDSLETAERVAAEAAAEIARDQVPHDGTRAVTVEVHNEHHQRVLTVTVSMEVYLVQPPPEPPRA
jgi:hypothetical protein